jgi:hypothetical protein
MKRQLNGLKWAKRLIGRPAGIPIGRPRGAKAAGIRYEKAIGAELSEARRGVWFEFEDRNGPGWCQVDFLLPWASRAIVLEAKYTWIEDAHLELERLYVPIVEAAGFARPIGIVVARRLIPGMDRILVRDSLSEAIEAAGRGRSVLHWIAHGPLLRRAAQGHASTLARACALV